jgi:hypothetical protein
MSLSIAYTDSYNEFTEVTSAIEYHKIIDKIIVEEPGQLSIVVIPPARGMFQAVRVGRSPIRRSRGAPEHHHSSSVP